MWARLIGLASGRVLPPPIDQLEYPPCEPGRLNHRPSLAGAPPYFGEYLYGWLRIHRVVL